MTPLKIKPQGQKQWRWVGIRLAIIILFIMATLSFSIGMPGSSFSGNLPPLSAAEIRVAENLKTHVQTLAGDIGQRNIWTPGSMEASERYISEVFKKSGYELSFQEFTYQGRKSRNIEVEKPGKSDEILIIGAHYDSVLGSPGANDNASGVASLLELARLLASRESFYTIRLVAFANEEPPFYYTAEMGSSFYAKRCKERKEKIIGMLSLETMGHYVDEAKSQKYPFPLSLFYPDRANFVAFVGNLASRNLVRQMIGDFRRTARFPSEGLAAPEFVIGVGWSDHWSFWQEGYPALMLTDTAFFRSPHYHTAADTPEKLQYDAMARITMGMSKVVSQLKGIGK